MNNRYNAWKAKKEKEYVETATRGTSYSIFTSIKNGEFQSVKCLINTSYCLSEKVFPLQLYTRKENVSPLYIAAQYGRHEITDYLLEKYAGKLPNDAPPWTPLAISVLRGHYRVTRTLLKQKEVDTDIKFTPTKTHKSNLWHVSAFTGDHNVIKCLHDAKVTGVNDLNDHSDTPLSIAAYFGHETAVKSLLKYKADLSRSDNNPLFSAAEGGHTNIIDILGLRNPDLYNMANSDNGWTPLMAAVCQNKEAAVKLLLERKADIECKSRSSFYNIPPNHTALMIANLKHHQAVTKLFYKYYPQLDPSFKSLPERSDQPARRQLFTDNKEAAAEEDVVLLDLLSSSSNEFKKAFKLIKEIGKRGEAHVYNFIQTELEKILSCTGSTENLPSGRRVFTIKIDKKTLKLEWLNFDKESRMPYDMELTITDAITGVVEYRCIIEVKSTSRKNENAKAFFSENEWKKMLDTSNCSDSGPLSVYLEDEKLCSEIIAQARSKNTSPARLCEEFIRIGMQSARNEHDHVMVGEPSYRPSAVYEPQVVSNYKEKSSYSVFFVRGCGRESKPAHNVITNFNPLSSAHRLIRVVPFPRFQSDSSSPFPSFPFMKELQKMSKDLGKGKAGSRSPQVLAAPAARAASASPRLLLSSTGQTLSSLTASPSPKNSLLKKPGELISDQSVHMRGASSRQSSATPPSSLSPLSSSSPETGSDRKAVTCRRKKVKSGEGEKQPPSTENFTRHKDLPHPSSSTASTADAPVATQPAASKAETGSGQKPIVRPMR